MSLNALNIKCKIHVGNTKVFKIFKNCEKKIFQHQFAAVFTFPFTLFISIIIIIFKMLYISPNEIHKHIFLFTSYSICEHEYHDHSHLS